jgi:hypothetical protein
MKYIACYEVNAMSKKLIHLVEIIETGEKEGDLILVDASENEMRKLRDEYKNATEFRETLDFIGFLHEKGVKFVDFQYDILGI